MDVRKLCHRIQDVEVAITLNATWILDTTGGDMFLIGADELFRTKLSLQRATSLLLPKLRYKAIITAPETPPGTPVQHTRISSTTGGITTTMSAS